MKKQKKKRRKLPKNIVEKTDREAMTQIFGKRVMKEVDHVLEEQSDKSRKPSME